MCSRFDSGLLMKEHGAVDRLSPKKKEKERRQFVSVFLKAAPPSFTHTLPRSHTLNDSYCPQVRSH